MLILIKAESLINYLPKWFFKFKQFVDIFEENWLFGRSYF
jgi:hypothetical protein